MDKKISAVYISGGVLALAAIIVTIILAIGMGNKPVNICMTSLTEDMAGELLKGYCGIKESEMGEYIKKAETRDAYSALIDNSADVVFVSEADEDTLKWLKLNGVEIEKNIIAKDALVFINNVNNPVTDLTSAQLKGIYSGKILNWSEINGQDEEIIAYSSYEGSEEEHMMKKFMQDELIRKPRYKLKDNSFVGLVNAASRYLDTRTKAIFYTTYRNIKNLDNKEIRMLKTDGTEVSEETIKRERYHGTMNIYAVIRSDTPENSQTRKFVEYITSKNGQAVIEQCGYVNLIK